MEAVNHVKQQSKIVSHVHHVFYQQLVLQHVPHVYQHISSLLTQSHRDKLVVHAQLMDAKSVNYHQQTQSVVCNVKKVNLYLMVHVIHVMLTFN